MKNPSINTNSFNIHKLVALSQEWKMSGAYSYLDNPRPDNGLSLILKGKFIYTFLDNSFFTAQSGDVIYIPKGINYKVYFISDSDKSSINASLINFILINDEGKGFLFNDKITKIYEDSSGKLTQIFHKIIDLYMLLKGVRENVVVEFIENEVNDEFKAAQADQMRTRATVLRFQNGFIDSNQAAQECGYDKAALDLKPWELDADNRALNGTAGGDNGNG